MSPEGGDPSRHDRVASQNVGETSTVGVSTCKYTTGVDAEIVAEIIYQVADEAYVVDRLLNKVWISSPG